MLKALTQLQSDVVMQESRVMVEEMALLLQAACLNSLADQSIATAFGQARLVDRGFQMGTQLR